MNIRWVGIAAAAALALTLSACETATPYQPNVRGNAVAGGFSEQRLDADHFRVTFQGNTLTSRETVETYLLYRAAELTVNEGGDWFTIVDRETSRDRQTYYSPDPFYDRPGWRYGYWRPSWRYYGGAYGWRGWDPWGRDPFWADRMDMQTVERFEATAEIEIHRGAKPSDEPRTFDAREVMSNLAARIQRPAP